jgi:hypothetical protein
LVGTEVVASNLSDIWLAKDDDRGLRRLDLESGVTGGDSTDDGFIGVGGRVVEPFSVNSGIGGMTRVTVTEFGSFSKYVGGLEVWGDMNLARFFSQFFLALCERGEMGVGRAMLARSFGAHLAPLLDGVVTSP